MTQQMPDMSRAAGPRYEARDANVRRLLLLGLSLGVVIVLALFGAAKVMSYLTTVQPKGRPVSPLATAADLPPKPRLQIAPQLDLAEKRKADDALLNSYAWIDRQSGTVRIPIDRAMELLAKRDPAAQDLARTHERKQRAGGQPPRLKRSGSR